MNGHSILAIIAAAVVTIGLSLALSRKEKLRYTGIVILLVGFVGLIGLAFFT